VQHTNQGIERTERTDIFDRGSTPSANTGDVAFAKPCLVSDFESVLLAIAAHDLRQPLQVIQVLTSFWARRSDKLGAKATAVGPECDRPIKTNSSNCKRPCGLQSAEGE